MGEHELKTNTAAIIAVGPFFDKTDGVTLETSLTITNEKITLIAETDDGSAPTIILDNITGASSGTDNDLSYITDNDAAMMKFELTAANLNRYGKMVLIITDAANHVPVFEYINVVSAQFWDAKYGTGNFSADTKAISGDTTAADNLEAACDGNTYNVGGGAVVAASVTTKTGYELSATGISAIWHQLLTAITTADTIGKLIKDNLDAAISTRSSQTSVNTIDGILDDLHDTDIPAIKTVVDANGVKLTSIQGKTDMFPVIWYSA